jgi:hypothetical protein
VAKLRRHDKGAAVPAEADEVRAHRMALAWDAGVRFPAIPARPLRALVLTAFNISLASSGLPFPRAA